MGEFRKCKGQYRPLWPGRMIWIARAPGLLPEKTDAGSGSYLSHLLAS